MLADQGEFFFVGRVGVVPVPVIREAIAERPVTVEKITGMLQESEVAPVHLGFDVFPKKTLKKQEKA
jgi:hypothetical protein